MDNFILGAVIGATVVFVPMADAIKRLIDEWRATAIEALDYAERVNRLLTYLRSKS